MSDLFDVSKETILVTGASQGLGAAVRAGAVGAWRRGRAGGAADRQAESLEDEITGEGGRAAAVADGRHRHRLDRQGHRCRGGGARPGQRADQQCRHRDREARGRADRGRLGCRDQRQPQGRLFRGDRNGAADDRAQAGRQYRQHRLRARLRRDEIPLALHDLQGRHHPGHQGDGAGTGRPTASASMRWRRAISTPR